MIGNSAEKTAKALEKKELESIVKKNTPDFFFGIRNLNKEGMIL